MDPPCVAPSDNTHTFNFKRLGKFLSDQNPRTQNATLRSRFRGLYYSVSVGFTSYFVHRSMIRAGGIEFQVHSFVCFSSTLH